MKAFIVIGRTGEYDSASEWPVAVYLDKQAALDRAEFLNALVLMTFGTREAVFNNMSATYDEAKRAAITDHPQGDPDFHMDYTGTEYALCTVPFIATN